MKYFALLILVAVTGCGLDKRTEIAKCELKYKDVENRSMVDTTHDETMVLCMEAKGYSFSQDSRCWQSVSANNPFPRYPVYKLDDCYSKR